MKFLIDRLLKDLGTDPADVLAISVSGYGSGLYLLDGAGNPTRPGIVSTDGRAAGLIGKWTADGRAADLARRRKISRVPRFVSRRVESFSLLTLRIVVLVHVFFM